MNLSFIWYKIHFRASPLCIYTFISAPSCSNPFSRHRVMATAFTSTPMIFRLVTLPQQVSCLHRQIDQALNRLLGSISELYFMNIRRPVSTPFRIMVANHRFGKTNVLSFQVQNYQFPFCNLFSLANPLCKVLSIAL